MDIQDIHGYPWISKAARSCSIILPLKLRILPEGSIISAPFLEPAMLGYTVPDMEPPISPCTTTEAAEGRLHIGGWRDLWFHIWYNIFYHIWVQNSAETDVILPEGLLYTTHTITF